MTNRAAGEVGLVATWRGRPVHELSREELEAAYTTLAFELDRERQWARNCITMSDLLGAPMPRPARPATYNCPGCGVPDGNEHQGSCYLRH